MLLDIDVNGRRRTVQVERAGDGEPLQVTLDGRTQVIDVVRVDGAALSLLFDEGRASEYAAVAPTGAPGVFDVHVRGGRVQVQVARDGNRRRSGSASGPVDGPQPIVAPMPGKIVRVLVARGDAVEAKQPVVVVEAMKMENELTSPKAGVVQDVFVEAGASVEAGRVLVIVA